MGNKLVAAGPERPTEGGVARGGQGGRGGDGGRGGQGAVPIRLRPGSRGSSNSDTLGEQQQGREAIESRVLRLANGLGQPADPAQVPPSSLPPSTAHSFLPSPSSSLLPFNLPFSQLLFAALHLPFPPPSPPSSSLLPTTLKRHLLTLI